MLEALWTIKFITDNDNYGGGVIVFETGRIFGGDHGYYYIGEYSTDQDQIQARVTVKRHASEAQSIFGDVAEFELHVEGEINEPDMMVFGYRPGASEYEIGIALHKVTELP